ncbi:MAG: DUF1648 domain-containing protein [Candidatus Neomarinimicrobiota bacterium]
MENEQNKFEVLRPAVTVAILTIILMLIASAFVWQKLPGDARVAVHWNIAGQPDRYGSKFQGLMLMPLVTVAMMIVMVIVPLIEPRYRHIKSSMKAYNIILSAIVLLMAFLHLILLMAALGEPINIMKSVCLGIGLLFILIGNYSGKIRSNFFIGIKTPWTLSSELSWHKTHRLVSRLFIILGMTIGLSGLFLPGMIVFVILLCGVAGLLAAVTLYSYFVWKKDPHKKSL